MGRTTTELEEALKKFQKLKDSDVEFARLRQFYLEMMKQGMLVKKEYDIPPIDTIGRSAYRKSEE
jgi:hypothetical protein